MVLVFNGLSSLRKVTSNNPRNKRTSDIINITNKDPKGYAILYKRNSNNLFFITCINWVSSVFKEIVSFNRNKFNYNIWYLVFKCPAIVLLPLKSFAKQLQTPLAAGLGLKWYWWGVNYCENFHMQPTDTVFDFERMWLALTSCVCEFHWLVYLSFVIAPSVVWAKACIWFL